MLLSCFLFLPFYNHPVEDGAVVALVGRAPRGLVVVEFLYHPRRSVCAVAFDEQLVLVFGEKNLGGVVVFGRLGRPVDFPRNFVIVVFLL